MRNLRIFVGGLHLQKTNGWNSHKKLVLLGRCFSEIPLGNIFFRLQQLVFGNFFGETLPKNFTTLLGCPGQDVGSKVRISGLFHPNISHK